MGSKFWINSPRDQLSWDQLSWDQLSWDQLSGHQKIAAAALSHEIAVVGESVVRLQIWKMMFWDALWMER